MKHIRRYNESLLDEDTLKEICYDLTDTGLFSIIISTSTWSHHLIKDYGVSNLDKSLYRFYITVNNNKLQLLDNDVREVVYRIKDYLGSKYVKAMVYVYNKGSYKWIDIKDIEGMYMTDVVFRKITILYED